MKPQIAAALRATIADRRRAAQTETAGGLLDWSRTFLPLHTERPYSAMHRWLAMQLDAADKHRGAKVNVLGPRGAAKSTIGTLAYPLRCACRGSEPYIWILSDTKSQAASQLGIAQKQILYFISFRLPPPCGEGWGGGSAAAMRSNHVYSMSWQCPTFVAWHRPSLTLPVKGRGPERGARHRLDDACDVRFVRAIRNLFLSRSYSPSAFHSVARISGSLGQGL